MKSFFENPELLFAVPLLGLGLFGMVVAFSAIAAPQTSGQAVAHKGHPGDRTYIRVGIILAVITAVEVALFYIDMEYKLLILLLVILSAVKFFIVVSWFMHLRFDSPIFTTAFVTGLFLAGACFTVVLATLGGGLV